ncbi:MAG TPA: flavin reductase [Nocardioidaceae bacterium]|nr:flavin reductase [Nocardioidaceae bacterium]
MTTPRRVAIVGAGPAGTALALGLVHHGHQVTLVSDRTAEQIRAGAVMSSQITFESALAAESALGLTELLPVAPAIGRMSYAVERADGSASEFATDLPTAARSLDQRVRLPLLMAEVQRLGGTITTAAASVGDVEDLAREHDLVVVSTGRGGLASLFEVDSARTPYTAPMRVAALTYLHGMAADPAGPGLRYTAVEGVGECFTCPALSVDGPCDIVVVEGVPGGPLDVWDDVHTPADHLARLQEVIGRHFPAEAARAAGARLVDDGAVLRGAITPVVRRPVGELPSGAPVLGMADVVVLNDPATAQGANNAIKSASYYLDAISGHAGDLDAAWMLQTFENFWRGWAQWATEWTSSWLQPARPHQRTVVEAATRHPVVAERMIAGFDDARLFAPWWFDAAECARFLRSLRLEGEARFDPRDLRRALGQYATGVTVVTTVDADGRPFGMTANSFTSVSINPPLVLWAAAKSSPSLVAFEASELFAVNVLASDQHHLSRQFSTSGADKFDGVRLSPGDLPLLEGTVAHFVCRRTSRVDAGDHVVFLGEIESYEAPGGEPLVFHSGYYRVATRHPDL